MSFTMPYSDLIAVSGGEAAGHGYSWIDDIAVAAGSFPLMIFTLSPALTRPGRSILNSTVLMINLCLLSKRTCHLIVTSSCFHIHENKKHVGFTICWFK